MTNKFIALASLLLATAAAQPVAARTVTFDVTVADDVQITDVSAPVRPGERFSFGQSVSRSAGAVDIIFLSDVTGSMGRLTDAARREADDIVARTSTLAGDVAWTVASYRDFPQSSWGGSGDEPFILDQSITTDPSAAAGGLRNWRATGGADGKESGLHALNEVATRSDTLRDGSDRFLLWFGDEPSHDPFDTLGYPGPTLAATEASLLGAGITVLGVDLRNLNGDGELNRLVAATGGSKGTLSESLSDTVFDSLLEAIDPRTDLTLDFSLTSADGAATFSFMKTFDQLVRGFYRISVDTDTLTSSLTVIDQAFNPDPGIAPIPLPAGLPLLGGALVLIAGIARRKRAA